jgi:hypothetical protein
VRHVAFICLLVVLGACASTTTVYRDTWQPIAAADSSGQQRLVVAALLTGPEGIGALRDAGAAIIGYHEAHKAWALRAGSTGGTHFVPVAESSSSHTDCATWAGFTSCVSGTNSRWTRVAVLRVEASRWHELPVYLIPPTSDIVEGVAASARRDGCDVNHGRGTVRCGSGWKLVASSVAPR